MHWAGRPPGVHDPRVTFWDRRLRLSGGEKPYLCSGEGGQPWLGQDGVLASLQCQEPATSKEGSSQPEATGSGWVSTDVWDPGVSLEFEDQSASPGGA